MNKNVYNSMEELYTDNRKFVFVVALDYTTDINLAEEIVQHTWLKVFENEKKFRNKEKDEVKNYLRIMVRNLSFDYYKKSKRELQVNEEFFYIQKIESNSNDNNNKEMEVLLNSAMQTLCEEDFELIYLKYYCKLKSKEIAFIMNLNDGQVRMKMLRIREKLRAKINILGKGEV